MNTELLQRHLDHHNGHIRHTFSVRPDVMGLQVFIVNVYFVGDPKSREQGWVLIDAGMPFSAHRIIRAAEERFGKGNPPCAIILTHGHFDHVGALRDLVKYWDVPVYAHEMELPYLTGRSAYPPPDPTVGGGLMARSARLYPKGPINLGSRVRALPDDGSVQFMEGWRWVFTPGHSPGHVSFFRDSDKTLIAGDAFVTTKQESLLSVISQRKEIHGPPMYYTPDWPAARASVRRLAALGPHHAGTGHGLPMSNPRLMHELNALARDFDRVAVPAHGRYVHRPALADERGVVEVPPPAADPVRNLVLVSGAIAAAFTVATILRKNERRGRRHP